MPNTTNYSFPTPADTDLVKNGADAIRDLGDAVDTAMNTALGTKKAGMVLLNTTSFSAVASQSVNDVFSATYKNYLVQFNMSGSTTATDVAMRLRVSGADNSSTNYTRSGLFQSSTSITGQRLTGQTSWDGIAEVQSALQNASQFTIFNPFATAETSGLAHLSGVTSGNITMTLRTFGISVTTSYTGFTIIAGSGTLTGSLSVYGFNV
jgi:hypothetical protein